jgi:hypothetical protein
VCKLNKWRVKMSIIVSKSVDVEIQIDFIKCNNCGKELDFTAETDSFGDIQAHVEKCECED